MSKFKNIFILLFIGYLLIDMYNNRELNRILNYGDGLISGKYHFNNRYSADVRVYRTNKGIDNNSDCIGNMKLKQIDISPYVATYRGSDSNGTIMCELSVFTESEGKNIGELLASVSWFYTSDIDKFPIGKASSLLEHD